jgi:hypothetical protein
MLGSELSEVTSNTVWMLCSYIMSQSTSKTLLMLRSPRYLQDALDATLITLVIHCQDALQDAACCTFSSNFQDALHATFFCLVSNFQDARDAMFLTYFPVTCKTLLMPRVVSRSQATCKTLSKNCSPNFESTRKMVNNHSHT